MKLNRFILNSDINKEEIIIEDIKIVKQIKNVLRLENGDHIVLLDGKGRETEVEIVSISKEVIQTKFVKDTKINEPERKVSLYLAILKKENFELAVQKAVECGVSEIIPIITERTIKTGLNTARLEKIIKEACEQSGRSVVPKLSEIMSFAEGLEHGKESEEKTIFHLGGKDYRLDGSKASVQLSVAIFIGPEGGFSDKEISLAIDSGYTVASLGSLVLRGETAAIVATYRAVQAI